MTTTNTITRATTLTVQIFGLAKKGFKIKEFPRIIPYMYISIFIAYEQ